jgi:hypothetical protein
MFKRKTITILLTILFLGLIIFSGCNNESKKNKDCIGTKIIDLEEKDPPHIVDALLEFVPENERIGKSEIIFKGKVIKKRELLIEIPVSGEDTYRSYASVFSFSIEELYYSKGNESDVGEIVKLLSGYSSYNWIERAVKINEGEEFIVFGDLTEDNTNEEAYTSLAKYVIGNPWNSIIPVKGNKYEIDEIFTSLTQKAVKEKRKISENYSYDIFIREDDDFISDLKALIKKYK